MPRLTLTADEKALLSETIKAISDALPVVKDLAYRRATVTHPNAVHAKVTIVTSPTPLRIDAAQLLSDSETLIRDAAIHIGLAAAKIPGLPLGMCVRFLLDNVDVLASRCDEKHGDPSTWLEDFMTLRRRIDTMLNPPENDRVTYGSCPVCGTTVYGPPDGDIGTCTRCRAIIPRSLVHAGIIGRVKAAGIRGTARDLSNLLAKSGWRIPAGTIRTWAHRGRLTQDKNGLYALADVMKLAGIDA